MILNIKWNKLIPESSLEHTATNIHSVGAAKGDEGSLAKMNMREEWRTALTTPNVIRSTGWRTWEGRMKTWWMWWRRRRMRTISQYLEEWTSITSTAQVEGGRPRRLRSASTGDEHILSPVSEGLASLRCKTNLQNKLGLHAINYISKIFAKIWNLGVWYGFIVTICLTWNVELPFC